MPSHCVKLLLDDVGDGRLARSGQPGEPEHARLLPLGAGALALVDIHGLPVNVLASPQREFDHAGTGGRVGVRVD